MGTLRDQVLEFHRVLGVDGDRMKPGDHRQAIKRLRASLIAEEFFELLYALGMRVPKEIRESVFDTFPNPMDPIDLPAFADAMADLDYVVEGTRIAFGIDGGPIAREVHRANMAKLGGPRRDDGKILKPDGWTPPDIRGRLLDQGWKP